MWESFLGSLLAKIFWEQLKTDDVIEKTPNIVHERIINKSDTNSDIQWYTESEGKNNGRS